MASIASRIVKANIQDLSQLQDWCIDNSIEYPKDVWHKNKLCFKYWQFKDGSKVRYDDMLGLVEVDSNLSLVR